jgi:uncharacterized RmlC-like cupin family protein
MLMGNKKADPDIPCSRCMIFKRREQTNNWISSEDIEKALTGFDEDRRLILLKNRLLKLGIINKIMSQDHEIEKIKGPAPAKINISNAYMLKLPLEIPDNKKWKSRTIFKGITGNHWEISCHASGLKNNSSPHKPHSHREEELLLLLSGNVKLILPDNKDGDIKLDAGQFVYYPSLFPHTLYTTSTRPANYLMLRWTTKINNKIQELGFSKFDSLENISQLKDITSKVMFEGRTRYLQKLHCHNTSLQPYKGYDNHIDDYDVVIIMLEGEVETLGRRVSPNDVIFYASGEPHGMHNPTGMTARYIVFEFHSERLSLGGRVSDRFDYYLQRIKSPVFWKQKLKRIYRPKN